MIQFPVTVLHVERLGDTPVPVHAWADTAVAAENNGLMWVKPLDRTLTGTFVRIDREGVSWCHGYHSERDAEVKALLAAWALSR